MKKFIGPILIIVIAVILRLVPHPPNVAPIGAMALFGGAYFGDKKFALIIPILALFLSDIFLGFHATMGYVYVSFVLTGFIGLWLSRNKATNTIFIASITSSVLFYIITNFGVWYSTDLYTKNFSGLLESYIMALPFLRNTIIGDIFYTGIFFLGYELLMKYLNFVAPVQLNSKR